MGDGENITSSVVMNWALRAQEPGDSGRRGRPCSWRTENI